MPYRSKTEATPGVFQDRSQGMISGVWQPVLTTLSNKIVQHKTLTKWYDSPPRRKPDGFIPPTWYNMAYTEQVYGPSSFYAHIVDDYGRSKTWYQGCWAEGGACYLYGLSDYDPRATNRAVLKSRENLKSQNVNYAQAFAERKQTANTVATTAKQIAQAASACMRRDIKGMKKALNINTRVTRADKAALKKMGKLPSSGRDPGHKASELWLANRYGWMPLLKDVHGAAQDLAERDTAGPQRYTHTVRSTGSVITSPGYTNRSRTPLGVIPCVVYTKLDAKSTCFVRLDYFLDNPALASLSSGGFTNPANLAWELLPFSFVADWFLPIGRYINSMDAQVGWQFRAGSRSERQHDRRKGWLHGDQQSITSKTIQITASGNWNQYSMRLVRNPYGSPPELANLLTEVKNPLSTSHVLSAIALLKQIFF